MAYYAQVSCELPRDPRMMAAGWQARAVYVESLLFCRENLTDGLVDERTLIAWMPDLSRAMKRKYLNVLVSVGAMESCPQGWRFPEAVWRKWNPTRSEVESKREQERQRKADWRRRKANNPQNVPEMSQRDSLSRDGHATGRPREKETETETETEVLRSPTCSTEPTQPVDKKKEVIDHIVNHRMASRAIGNPKGYRTKATRDVDQQHGERIGELLERFPTAPVTVIAGAIDSGDTRNLAHYATPEDET